MQKSQNNFSPCMCVGRVHFHCNCHHHFVQLVCFIHKVDITILHYFLDVCGLAFEWKLSYNISHIMENSIGAY